MVSLLVICTVWVIVGLKRYGFSRHVILWPIAFMFGAAMLGYGTGFLAGLGAQSLEIHEPLSAVKWQKRNLIVVLGGGVVTWQPTDHVSSEIFGYSRALEGARLYLDCRKNTADCKILCSGGDAKFLGTSEAEVIFKELQGLGIATEDLLVEDKSRSTFQNAELCAPIINQIHPDQVIVVTSAGHMRRALCYFSIFGVDALPAPSDYLASLFSPFGLGYNLYLMDLIFHEYLGISRCHLYNLLNLNPKVSV